MVYTPCRPQRSAVASTSLRHPKLHLQPTTSNTKHSPLKITHLQSPQPYFYYPANESGILQQFSTPVKNNHETSSHASFHSTLYRLPSYKNPSKAATSMQKSKRSSIYIIFNQTDVCSRFWVSSSARPPGRSGHRGTTRS